MRDRDLPPAAGGRVVSVRCFQGRRIGLAGRPARQVPACLGRQVTRIDRSCEHPLRSVDRVRVVRRNRALRSVPRFTHTGLGLADQPAQCVTLVRPRNPVGIHRTRLTAATAPRHFLMRAVGVIHVRRVPQLVEVPLCPDHRTAAPAARCGGVGLLLQDVPAGVSRDRVQRRFPLDRRQPGAGVVLVRDLHPLIGPRPGREDPRHGRVFVRQHAGPVVVFIDPPVRELDPIDPRPRLVRIVRGRRESTGRGDRIAVARLGNVRQRFVRIAVVHAVFVPGAACTPAPRSTRSPGPAAAHSDRSGRIHTPSPAPGPGPIAPPPA